MRYAILFFALALTGCAIGTRPHPGDGMAIISGKLKQPQEVVSGMVLEIQPGALRSDEF